jgi:hypothetical protein
MSFSVQDSRLDANQILPKVDILAFNLRRYLLHVDCDEYLDYFGSCGSVSSLFEKISPCCSIDIPWVVNVIVDPKNPHKHGILDLSRSKEIAVSDLVLSINDGHRLSLVTKRRGKFGFRRLMGEATKTHIHPRAKGERFGLYLVHHWTRSFRECLIKGLTTNIQNKKNIGFSEFKASLFCDFVDLPARMRIFAWLNSQSRFFLTTTYGICDCYDLRLEEHILSGLVAIDEELRIRALFDEYSSLVAIHANQFPAFPGKPSQTNLSDLARDNKIPTLRYLKQI